MTHMRCGVDTAAIRLAAPIGMTVKANVEGGNDAACSCIKSNGECIDDLRGSL